jgi:hypothetical protein
MPSPFSGMDPYLEDPDLWPDVHAELITDVRQHLTPKLLPNYVARVEQRTYLFDQDDPASELYVVPDARILEREWPAAQQPSAGLSATGTLAIADPIDVTGLVVREVRQRYLEIRDRTNQRVVTVIEILSPSNKVTGSASRRAFEAKRQEVSESDASWLEIDLLRRGSPTINFANVPRSAYRAYADRTLTDGRQQLAWPIRLRERLPVLPVPLKPGEADVTLDLQAVLQAAFERAAYDQNINYGRPSNPPLNPDDAEWADALLREKGLRR